MNLSKFMASQFANPNKIFGNLAGLLWNHRNMALNNVVLESLALQSTDRVLDIGFGGGYLLSQIEPLVPDGWLAGIDVSPAMVAYCSKRCRDAIAAGKLELKCAEVESLPFPADYFTKVSSVNSIFYWRDVTQDFREIARVLKPGGKFVLCYTNKESLEKKNFAQNIRLFEPDEIAQILTEAGFQDIETLSFSDKHRKFFCTTAHFVIR